uniref:Uncharacterized protein n=1 Tax=Nothobranchius furzeri TaxID=105023 RepID=A0A8C6ML95_NOTFU
MISDVPDLAGVPPSKAVRVSLIKACFSRSNDFCRINSADTLSPLSSTFIVHFVALAHSSSLSIFSTTKRNPDFKLTSKYFFFAPATI